MDYINIVPQNALRCCVLDLSGPIGNYAGKLFADLGADVVLVEPPGGTQLRHEPPFLDDRAGYERSLSFRVQQHEQAWNHARLNNPDRATLRRLVATGGATDLIETERPGVMAEQGLGYDALGLAASAAGHAEHHAVWSERALRSSKPRTSWRWR